MILRITCILSLVFVLPNQSLACRYTVRDIGFAMLRSHEYALVLSWAASEDPLKSQQLTRTAEEWTQVLRPLLAGSNITVVIDQNRTIETESTQQQDEAVATPSTDLKKAPGQPLVAHLLDRSGRSLDLSSSLESLSDPQELSVWLEDQVFIPLLRQISNESLESFAHLMVVEGSDANENSKAHQVADQALAAIRRLEPLLPRPIAFPLRKIVVSQESPHQQRSLRWMLGSDGQDAGTLLAVVYGRGRLAGPVMRGDRLLIQEVLAQLALVGQSCECETDRAWLEEPSLPFNWDANTRNRASSFLGFDPDSPLVRAEMLRIVSQGPKSPSSRKSTESTDSPDAIARMLLGYSESQLQPSDDSGQQVSPVIDLPIASPGQALGSPSGVQATVIAGDGWDFDPPVAKSNSAENNQSANATAAVEPVISVASDPAGEGVAFVDESTAEAANRASAREIVGGTSISQVLMISLASLVGVSLIVVLALIVRNK